jgi:dTMP kinase
VDHLVSRVVLGRGAFDYWESGMDLRFGSDMYQSFLRYQGRMIKALDAMAEKYNFTVIDATRPADAIFRELQEHIGGMKLRHVRNRSGRAAVRQAKPSAPQ